MSEANQKNIPADKLVRVTFQPEGKTVEFEFGTMPYEHHGKPMSFLDVAENFNVFLDHACGGVCACTTCHLWIKDQEGISEAEDDELDRMDMAADQQLDSRLGCQAVITKPGNYVVEIPKWNRNYVSEGKPLTLAEDKVRRSMPREIHWTDAEEIGIQLQEKFPDLDPLTVRFTDLHRYVTELEGFADDPAKSNESRLEAIQMAWHEEFEDAQG